VNGVSVALDETTREVSERQVLPAGGLRERIEQQRPIAALGGQYSFTRRVTDQFGRSSIASVEFPRSWQSRRILGLAPTNAEIGVPSVSGWPCGQNSQPKPECHQRRDPRHEAGGIGYSVLTAGPVPDSHRRYPNGPVASSLPD
jgi:hypothetical protein